MENTDTWITGLGLLSGSLTTLSVLPQAVRLWKTGRGNDISIYTCLMNTTGVLGWAIYASFIKSGPLLAANVVALVLNSSVLALKARST